MQILKIMLELNFCMQFISKYLKYFAKGLPDCRFLEKDLQFSEAATQRCALQLYWNRTSTWVFPCKFAAYFQNTFSQEQLWMAASVFSYNVNY